MFTQESDSELIRIQAPSYREALEKITRDYGTEVSVVRTRVIKRSGIAGMVGGRAVEVLLSPGKLRPGKLGPVAPKPVAFRSESAASAPAAAPAAIPNVVDRVSETVRRLVEAREAYEQKQRGALPVPKEEPKSSDLDTRVEEVSELRSDHSATIRRLGQLTLELGFSPETASQLVREAVRLQRSGRGGSDDVKAMLGPLLQQRLPYCSSVWLPGDRESEGVRAIACVGPTGVGKTTTLAKLAAPLTLIHRKKVAILALDTFRIGATEQVRRYGDIMGVTVIVADDLDDLDREAENLSEYDAVFIDTPGTNQRQVRLWDEIRSKIQFFENVEIHLCLPANGALDFCLECVERLRPVRYDRLLFTKVDEAVRLGHLLDIWERARVPVSYFTCGQNVPDDIRVATPGNLESLLWGEYA